MDDSNNNIWLNSIDANTQLSNANYKKIPISVNDNHGINLKQFFNNGNTPSNIIFDLKKSIDDTKTSLNFEEQFDFDCYTSSAKYLNSKYYNERFSYLAPLYLKDNIPEYYY